MDLIDLWWLSLGAAAVVVVVVAVLLGLVVAAAREVDRHAEAIWTVGKQIAGHTVSIRLLDQVGRNAHEIRDSLQTLDDTVASMARKLDALAQARGGSG